MKRREWVRAARLTGAVEAYRELSGTPRSPSEQREFDTAHQDLVKRLSHCERTSALEEGRKMTLEAKPSVTQPSKHLTKSSDLNDPFWLRLETVKPLSTSEPHQAVCLKA